MATPLIGLMGRKRSGKDTFAERLVEAHGYKRFAFADKLREAALAIDPWVGTALPDSVMWRLSTVIEHYGWEGVKGTEYDAEVRRTLQRVGVTARELDPDIWVRPVMDAVDDHDGPAVITDVRFPNELGALHHRYGWSTRILRPGLPTGDTHISETALDEAAVTLAYHNVGTLEDLHAMADQAAYHIAAE